MRRIPVARNDPARRRQTTEGKARQLVNASSTQHDHSQTPDGDAPQLRPALRTERHELFGIPIPQNPHEAEIIARLGQRTAKRKVNHAMHVFLELALIVTICLAGEKLSELLPIDVPSNICSMIVLLVFLVSGVLKMDSIAEGADFLLDHMSIFFIPAAVAIMGSFDLLAGNIIKLVVICLITTVLVFFVTSFTVSTVMNLMMRRDERLAAEVGMDVEGAAAADVSEMERAVTSYNAGHTKNTLDPRGPRDVHLRPHADAQPHAASHDPQAPHDPPDAHDAPHDPSSSRSA